MGAATIQATIAQSLERQREAIVNVTAVESTSRLLDHAVVSLLSCIAAAESLRCSTIYFTAANKYNLVQTRSQQ